MSAFPNNLRQLKEFLEVSSLGSKLTWKGDNVKRI